MLISVTQSILITVQLGPARNPLRVVALQGEAEDSQKTTDESR